VSIRFYCPDPAQNGSFRLSGDEARHVARVSRHCVGDFVELFDGNGFATRAQIVEIVKDRVELIATGQPIAEHRAPCPLTLATAIPKGDRFDWLVEKATEIGVSRLIPLVTERSVVDPRGSKLERLRRTIVEAAKQSRRSRLMSLGAPIGWTEFVRSVSGHACLIARPDGLPPGRWPGLTGDRPIVLAVGPEGGFSSAEEKLAQDHGWQPIELSRHVLRIETAALVGCAAILTRCEEQNDDAMA
jgi:16S rRNA (uracil1498-N3)-methyltransferase